MAPGEGVGGALSSMGRASHWCSMYVSLLVTVKCIEDTKRSFSLDFRNPSGDRAREVMSTFCHLQLFHIQFVNINVLIFAFAANVLKVLISFRIKGRTTKYRQGMLL